MVDPLGCGAGGHQDRVGGRRLHGAAGEADHLDRRARQRVLQEMDHDGSDMGSGLNMS